MTRPRPDRSGFRAALLLWLAAVVGVMVSGLDPGETEARRWLGHWATIVWAFAGWVPALLLARSEPQPPEDRQ